MGRTKKIFLGMILGLLMTLSLCFGVVFSLPTRSAKADTVTLSADESWTLAHESTQAFRIQNGNEYWSTYTNNVTTASMLDYTEINGKTLSAINEETPGAITVTLQPAGGTIGSFYRVTIDTDVAGFTMSDIGTVVIRSGWSHTDANASYTIDTDMYFARQQGKVSQNDTWQYVTTDNVVDITDDIQIQDQGIQATNTRAILIKTTQDCWQANTPNEGGAAFLNLYYVNGTSVKEWNEEAHAALDAGEITDITYGSGHGTISGNKGVYAPIFVWNSAYLESVGGSYAQVWIPTGYISNVSSFKICKGMAWLTDAGKLYYVSQDIEYVKSGSSFVKVSSTVDISDAFKLLVQDYTESNGTMLYYLHTNNVQYWTAQYDSTGAYSINEKEWKGVSDTSLQGGAVQMSYLEFNGTPIYDINASDNDAYGATQGNIASGTKYAPILAFLTPAELGSAIKLQIPSQYPSGSGTASDNHMTLAIKKGFYVLDTSTNTKYEVTKDIQWDYSDGAWGEHVEKIETSVTMATIFGSSTDAFAGIALENSDYAKAASTYAGAAKTAVSFAQSANFLSHILIDDVALSKPSEAFLNVWNNYGYFTFRPGNNTATKITVLAGCQFPTYDALLNGTNEVYVTTEDVTYVQGSDGTWALEEVIKEGEYETSVSKVVYAAADDGDYWMRFTLSDKDYPDASETDDISLDEDQVAALNLYDKIVVNGYTVRSLIAQNGDPEESGMINLEESDCFAIRIPGMEGSSNGEKVTIKAGAQFPSYAYATKKAEVYYVTKEDVTYVNKGRTTGVWRKQYSVTFVADGEVVAVSNYIWDDGEDPTPPDVPEKDGYRGEWESFEAGSATNITVNAVYTKKPTSLGSTSIKEIRRIDNDSNILMINPTTSDYPESVEGYWNLGLDVSYLSQFNLLDYITINGETLRNIGISSMAINKFTRAGLGLETTLSDSMTIVIKKGCEIPSYAFWQDPTSESAFSCYTVDADYTCEYAAGGEAAFTITAANKDEGSSLPADFDDHYVLSDLHNVAYSNTAGFKDGVETLTYTDGGEADYHYGFIGSTSFTLSFDFRYTGAAFYDTFYVNLGTEGYGGNKYHFGWRFYLLRGDSSATVQNFCVEYFSNTSTYKGNITNSANETLGSAAFVAGETYHVTIGYKLIDATTGEVQIYTAINNYSRTNNYVLGGDFIGFAPYVNSLTMNTMGSATVVVSDPYMEDVDTERHRMILMNGASMILDTEALTFELPALNPAQYGMAGYVFVGWTTDTTTLETLYPAGYELTLTGDTTLYPVWIGFKMRDGAAVRTVTNSSGIRFLVDVDKAGYEFGLNLGKISQIGTIVAPTDYLKTKELTHALGDGYYMSVVTSKWQVNGEDNATWTYSAAFTNISADQYTRSLSARGYMEIQYTSGVGYIYTDYDEANNARSIYEVATKAYGNNEISDAVTDYVNSVADITVDSGLTADKNSTAYGNYKVTASTDGAVITITVDNGVKAVIVNGARLVIGYDTEIMIDTVIYTLSGYSITASGISFNFTLEANSDEDNKEYYLTVLQEYLDSTAYTAEHEALVDSTAQAAYDNIKAADAISECKGYFVSAVTSLETIKTAAELQANNTSDDTLDAPTLSKGLGYTVTWSKVTNADYYTVYDDNNYLEYAVVMADETLSYKAEVIGDHNVYVVAHSYYEAYNSSNASNTVATPKVKPVFSYKSMSDGLYKFDSDQMSAMGISTTGYYYDSTDGMYFAYYNKDTGWSPYPVKATDWTSPAEFPAHAARLKAMGNNVIMIAYDCNAMYREDETWATSRMRYIMDTAWSMGMKVLVCDEVFYELSMSDNSGSGATSKEQVTTAINNRNGFAEYVTHPAFYGFSLDDEPYGKYISAMSYTISALDDACSTLGVENPFYLACLFQYGGGETGTETYLSSSSLKSYYNKWLAIDGVDNYLYVDVYTQHAMDYSFASLYNRYEGSFDVVYGDLGGQYEFYQALTAHTQNDGTLSEQDLYMSMLYAAAHDVAGYSWFCYFPIVGELSGSMVGYDGNGYGNGIDNNASGCYYNAAATAGYQFELIQGVLDGYDWKTRSVSGDLLTTTLSNGTNTATMYVNADLDGMSSTVSCTPSGSQCYLVGYNVGTTDAPYAAVTSGTSVTLQPGQAVICIS